MSRVSNGIIPIHSSVNIEFKEPYISVDGPKGNLSLCLMNKCQVKVVTQEKRRFVHVTCSSKNGKTFVGTYTSIIQNMIHGVSIGFTKTLEINGVGYKAFLDKNFLKLSLGYNDDIVYSIPDDIEIKVSRNSICVFGCDKHRVGQAASNIMSFRKVERYKGKGIRYQNQNIILKEGKK